MTITIDGEKFQHRIDKLHLEPDDIVVLKVPMMLYEEQVKELRKGLVDQLGTAHKVLILSYGVDIAVAVRDAITGEYMRIRGEFEDALKLLEGR